MTRKNLERLVQELIDGRIGEEEFGLLQEELRFNAAARAFYRESMEVELLICEALAARLPVANSPKPMEALLLRRQRRQLSRALIAAVAVVLFCAVVMHWVSARIPDRRILVEFTPGTSWSGTAGGGELKAGETVNIQFGLAEFKLPNGVRGVIEGPARFMISSPRRLDLLEGRGWFRVEEKARGFQVQTPRIRVTDLGTEFGILSRQNDLDEVHVFEGRVLALSRFGIKNQVELAAGKAAKASPIGRWVDREPDKDAFFTKLPTSLPGIRFTFDGADPLRPEGNHPAVERMKVRRNGGGDLKLEEGIRGRALSIHGFDDVLVTDWPGIGGDEPRTIACWVRSDGGGGAFSGIVSWGDPDELRSGRFKFLVAKSPSHKWPVLRLSLGEHVNFSGSTPLETGRWHHVAVVFRGMRSGSGDMVELYVDGQREQVDPEFSQPPKRDQRIGTIIDSGRSMPLQIGTGPYVTTKDSFVGAIDDVYILPRALSEGEVRGVMGE